MQVLKFLPKQIVDLTYAPTESGNTSIWKVNVEIALHIHILENLDKVKLPALQIVVVHVKFSKVMEGVIRAHHIR